MNINEDSVQTADAAELSPAVIKKKTPVFSIIITIVAVILLAANVYQYFTIQTWQKNYSALESEYTPEFLQLNSITVNRFYEMIDNGEDCIIYVGRPRCPACQELAPALHDLIEELKMSDVLYYFNVQPIRPSGSDPDWVAFKERFGNIEGTPSFIHIKGGETIDSLSWPNDPNVIRDWLLAQ